MGRVKLLYHLRKVLVLTVLQAFPVHGTVLGETPADVKQKGLHLIASVLQHPADCQRVAAIVA